MSFDSHKCPEKWNEPPDIRRLDRHGSRTLLKFRGDSIMIRKLKTGGYRLYTQDKDKKTGRRRHLGTFSTIEFAKRYLRGILQ